MGYAFNDNRLSGGVLVETDTIQCPHCQRHNAKPLRSMPESDHLAWCNPCGKVVCWPPCTNGCDPFMRRIERALSGHEFARAAGLIER